MALLAKVLPFNLKDNVFYDKDVLFGRATADMVYCKEISGHPVYLEKIFRDYFFAYVGLSTVEDSIKVKDVSEQLGIELTPRPVKLVDETITPVLGQNSMVCTQLCVHDLARTPLNIKHTEWEEVDHPLAAIFGGTAMQPVEHIEELRYTGGSYTKIFDQAGAATGLCEYVYKDVDRLRCYIRVMHKNEYAADIYGIALPYYEHPKFTYWLSSLGINVSDNILKQIKELQDNA